MKLDKFQEQVFFSTVRITIPSQSGSGSSVGTGFLLHTPLGDAENHSVVLLISNRHVFGDNTERIILNFHKRQENNDKPELGQTKIFINDRFKEAYYTHPDSLIDLACTNVSAIANENSKVFYRTLTLDMLSNFEEDDLLPGTDVWFVGYPENRFDTAHNLPILRKGYIASIPKVDFNNKKQFIIDAQVFPGSSGSPVFNIIGGKFKLIGVISETMIRNEQLQIVPTNMGLGINQVIGLGIVIKSIVVKELVDHTINKVRLLFENEKSKQVIKPPN